MAPQKAPQGSRYVQRTSGTHIFCRVGPRRTTLINRLPPEILTRIFLYVRAVDYKFRLNECPRWFRLLRVCRAWREVVYSSPRLWSHIETYPPNIVERWFKLSKSAPLVITLSNPKEETVDAIKGAIHRAHRLKFHYWRDPWPKLCALVSSPTPILESLSIELEEAYMRKDDTKRTWDQLFSANPQRLRHLSIKHCDPTSLHLFPNLAILEIHHPVPRLDAAAFLSILRHLPRIVSLRMGCALDPPPNYDRSPGPAYNPLSPETWVVELPTLEFFSLWGLCYAQDLDFLAHLSFKSTTTLLFSSGYPYHYASPYAAVTDFLKVRTRVYPNLDNIVPTSVQLLSEYGRLKLNFRDGDRMLCALKLDSQGGQCDERHDLPDSFEVTEMFELLSHQNVTEFSTCCYIALAVWPTISSCFPALKKVSISEFDWNDATENPSIVEAMIGDDRNKPASGWIPILPHLRNLSIQKAVFDDNCCENLPRVLQNRRNASCGLEEIHISECEDVDDKCVKGLREVEGLEVDLFELNQADDEKSFNVDAYIESFMEGNDEDAGEVALSIEEGAYIKQYEVDTYFGDDVDV